MDAWLTFAESHVACSNCVQLNLCIDWAGIARHIFDEAIIIIMGL